MGCELVQALTLRSVTVAITTSTSCANCNASNVASTAGL